jgi:hypothetical protein
MGELHNLLAHILSPIRWRGDDTIHTIIRQ